MITAMILVYLILFRAALSFPVNGTQICLTWKVRENHLVLNCKVFSFKYKLLVEDPFHQIRAECFKNRFPYCVVNRKEDMILDHLKENDFAVELKTGIQNADGKWKCYHENYEANVDINISLGNVYSADVYLNGEAVAVKEKIHFNLSCFSCWIPYTKSVYFLVNGVLEDSVRYHGGKCYHKRKACSQTECTCSKEGNNFTWSFISTLLYLEFSCEMQFKDEETSTLSIHTTNLIYNGSVFQANINRTRTILSTDKANGEKTGDIIKNVVLTMTTIILISLPAMQCLFPEMCGRIIQWILRCYRRKLLDLEERIIQWIIRCYLRQPLDLEEYTQLRKFDCTNCFANTNCAVCVDCKSFFCDICGVHHIKNNLGHIVLQTRHIAANKKQLICNTCNHIADRYCTLCWTSICTSCSTHHECRDKDIIIITDAHSEIKRQTDGKVIKLRHLYRISLDDDNIPVRVCGIAYLEGDTVVVIDGNNRKIIVFKSRKAQMKEELKSEHGDPNAMTAVAGNNFAVTYPERKYIQIYKLTLNTNNYKLSEEKKIDTLGKPFNIAYNHHKLAVEIGEGDDGRIIILDIEKGNIITQIKCKFAFFTGHTIRLALDKDHIFVSAMGKKMVSCLDFDGVQQWHQSIPSPRTIIVPDDQLWGKKLILSSRRCNAIYEMKKENGNYEIVKATGKISSPRYMAYQSDTKTLCILVENDKSHKDELNFFSVKYPEITDSISEADD